jgi:DNA processing protein
MNNDLLYQLALTTVPHIGHVHAKILVQQFGSAEAVFKAKHSQLEKTEGIGSIRARSIKSFTGFEEGREEIRFMEKYRIRPLFLTDPDYPQRLLHCYDSPTLLFYKGEADLNTSKIVAVIGTRSHTEYARMLTERLVTDLAAASVLIVSGLAYGVDALAHKAALKNQLPTVGVMAHGLDQVYPPDHQGLARDMIQQGGGLLTEFRSQTKPDKHHFPTRNRIVAGMSDAVIVVETGVRGGSMITAELADSYNKDVFALPGKTTDAKSAGCNHLIKTNKAILLTDAKELLEAMGWQEPKKKAGGNRQKSLFVELSKEERILVDILNKKETVHIDELNFESQLSSSAVAAALLNLELQHIVFSLPGKRYKLE